MSRRETIVAVACACLVAIARAQTAVGTAFAYQGQLKSNGSPLNGSADLQFRLYDAATGGTQSGSQITATNVAVTGGLFTVTLDFGVSPWTADQARWLEIDVRFPAGGGTFTTLSPRQSLTPTPFALNTRGIAVDSGGSVGIGTNNPTNRLTVANTGDNNTIVAITSGATAPQSSTLRLNDRGTAVWSVNKNSSNDFSIREVGSSADRLYVAQGGNVGIGTSSPEVKLQIQGGSDASPTGGGNLVCGGTGSNNVVIDNNEIMARNNGVVSPLYLNKDGGDVFLATGATTHASVLEISGGADLSERFEIHGDALQPGMVVVIDPDRPGELKPATQAYDRKVAGVISGAGGVQPGLLMSQPGSSAGGKRPVALTGRVYCLADCSAGAIQPGDFLTTSDTPGHAMKAADPARAQGAVLGKAMTALAAGQRGLVLVLVNLQ